MTKLALDITGMTCASCSGRVEKALSRVEGVKEAEVNLALERASIDLDTMASAEKLIAAVEKAGYGATIRVADAGARRRADETRDAARLAEERQTLLRFAVSALLSVILVVGMLPMMTATGPGWISGWAQAALAAGVMAVSGTRFYREAWTAVRAGAANMALLVTIGTTVAFAASLVEVVRGTGHAPLYFEATAVVLTLVMLGKALEARAKRGAASALTALGRLQPRQAERIGPDGAKTVAVEMLRPGDRVLVRPDAQIPADGTIAKGETSIDELLVTGESLPVERGEGDTVLTGTINGASPIEITVTGVGDDTRLARMARLVEDAQTGEAPIQRLVDRISSMFVPLILVAAVLTFAAWWLIAGDPADGFAAAIAVLVIACPCALGLATPTALVAGTGAAAKAGILIRDIETLERAENIGAVAFDKTGALTEGKPTVTKIAALGIDETELLALAAAAEAESEHPLGKALLTFAVARGVSIAAASNLRSTRGEGLVGTVGGRRVAVGNARLAAREGIAGADRNMLAEKLGPGGTIAFVIVDGRLSGGLLFADAPRPEAASVIAALHAQGLKTVMLTGDNEAAAAAIGKATGVENIRAGLLPEDKVAAVRALAKELGTGIAFVGDGANDGPALAAARLGIALSSGTDVAREAAAVTLMRADLRLAPAALDIARRTRNTIRQNLAWAFVYNLIGIPLAALGLLSPVMAGAAMAFSSVSVVANSARLARWKPTLGR